MTARTLGGAVTLLGVLVGLVGSGSGGELPLKAAAGVYAPEPDHPWNRLHRAVFVRTARDGKEVGADSLDPLLWPKTNHLLVGKSHEEVLARLDALLAPGALDAVRDPLKRAVLQRDLWAVFEWAADPYQSRTGKSRSGPGADREYPPGDHLPARKALQQRLVPLLAKLALTSRAISELPDNYAAAVKAKAFPARFDPDRPDAPFLPADLFDPDGLWVCVGGAEAPLTLAHARFFSGRAAFLVFLRLPDGRKATLDYLAALAKFGPPLEAKELKHADGSVHRFTDVRPGVPQFPAGTQVALVRRTLLIDADGRLTISPLTESVQLRVYRKVPPGTHLNHREALATQAFFEFELRRADLFAGKAGGLRAVPPDEPVYLALQFLTGFPDAFETDGDDARHVNVMPLRDTCAACHSGAGIHGVNSFTRRCSLDHGSVPDTTFRASTDEDELLKAAGWKRDRYLWGLLKGMSGR